MRSRSVWRFAWAAGLLLCCVVAATARGQDREKPLSAAEATAIDSVFSATPAKGAPGYALEVIKDGEVLYSKGYGEANLDDGVPITRETSFHLASVSKQFTAAAVALLVLDGRLALTDPVGKYIPEAKKYGDGLQVRHLLYMTSGVAEYTSLPRKSGMPWMTFFYFTRDEAIRTALEPEKLEFTPGSQWAYRNSNYMLLTKIVEVVSGKPFAEFMKERIFAPLGMVHTLIDDDTTEVIPHRAIGYAQRSDPRVIRELGEVGVVVKPGDGWVRLTRVSPHFGGSGVFSSLDDLLLWDRNWYSGKLAGSPFTELMNRRMKFDHDKDNDAWGLVWRTRYAHPMLDYSGGDTDTSTYMARFPEQRLTVICLSNNPLGDAEGKAKAVLEVLHDRGRL